MCAELSLPNYYNIEAKDTPSQLPLHESCPPRARSAKVHRRGTPHDATVEKQGWGRRSAYRGRQLPMMITGA